MLATLFLGLWSCSICLRFRADHCCSLLRLFWYVDRAAFNKVRHCWLHAVYLLAGLDCLMKDIN